MPARYRWSMRSPVRRRHWRKSFPLWRAAAKFDLNAARRDVEKFHSIYGRVAVLPPDQYNSLVLQATEGCAYSSCLFCELYRGVFYGRKTPAQFSRHLEDAIAYHGEALRSRRSIFSVKPTRLPSRSPTWWRSLQSAPRSL